MTRKRKPWSQLAPKTMPQRRALLKRCGPKAFLDPAGLKYPVMAKSGPCVVNCAGLRAARSRSGAQITIQSEKRKTKKTKKAVGRAKRIHTRAAKASKRAACY